MTTLYLALSFAGGVLTGYLLGRVDNLINVLRQPDQRPKDFFKQQAEHAAKAAVQIDTRTVVSKIDTSSLQNVAHAALGKSTITADDINSSVSKLAQLKGK
jgi:hypothetical protein